MQTDYCMGKSLKNSACQMSGPFSIPWKQKSWRKLLIFPVNITATISKIKQQKSNKYLSSLLVLKSFYKALWHKYLSSFVVANVYF